MSLEPDSNHKPLDVARPCSLHACPWAPLTVVRTPGETIQGSTWALAVPLELVRDVVRVKRMVRRESFGLMDANVALFHIPKVAEKACASSVDDVGPVEVSCRPNWDRVGEMRPTVLAPRIDRT